MALVFSIFLLTSASIPFIPANSPYDITIDMIQQTKTIKSLAYVMKSQERNHGKLIQQLASVKVNRRPFKVYTKQLAPKEGLEALYIEGQNNGKAIINPNGFPWVNLYLDPKGKIMCKDNHHLILNSGYDHVINILEHLIHKYGQQVKSKMRYKGQITFDGHKCDIIEFNNYQFDFVDYKVEKGETLLTIAEKKMICAHMIMENNKGVDSNTDISTGQIIKIPNDYCKKMVLYIDQQRKIPLNFRIFDHKGLYEEYSFTKVSIDPKFKAEEFSMDFEEYGF